MNKKELIEEGFVRIDNKREVYARMLSFTCFEFAQENVKKVIDLSDYTERQIADMLSKNEGYDTIRTIYEIYKEQGNFVIAGIIFQQESGLYGI